MPAFDGVVINISDGGLNNTAPSNDAIKALVLQGIATGSYNLGDILKLQSPDDAAAVGIDAAYDANYSIIVYGHIAEFFRESPEGTLYLMLVDNNTGLADMCDMAQPYLWKIVNDDNVNGSLKGAGVGLNPNGAYVPVLLNGLDSDVLNAVPNAQAICDAAATENMPLDYILIEGRQFNGTCTNAKDLTTLASKNVAICVGADPGVSAADPLFNTYACIGTLLGKIAHLDVSQTVGQVDGGNLSQQAPAKFLSAGLSSNLLTSHYSTVDQNTLDSKSYIFVGKYNNYPGVYFNNDWTCTDRTSDYCTIHANRAINKASRLAYAALMPIVKKTFDLAANGNIAAPVCANWQSLAVNAIAQGMNGSISGQPKAFVNPVFTVVGGVTKIAVTIKIQPLGIADELDVTLGLTATL